MTHRLAKIKKVGNRWHWYIVLHGSHGQAHVYSGDEPTFRLALASFVFADYVHVHGLSPDDWT